MCRIARNPEILTEWEVSGMSGVLMNGIQWEHCNGCHAWVDISKLAYELPSIIYPYGRDLCGTCTA